MNAVTIIDLPLEIVREIALIIDAPDTIALRQVHRSLRELPVKLDYELPGLHRIDGEIIQRYPNIYSFTGFSSPRRMYWFFNLHLTHPGYNNIRRLEVSRAKEICGPLPRALEELSIIPSCDDQCTDDTPIDLSPLKRLRTLKCRDDSALILGLPVGMLTMEIDIINITDLASFPLSFTHLEITNDEDREVDFIMNFKKFTRLEELEIFIDLPIDKLPPNLLRFYGTNLGSMDENGWIYTMNMVMVRPDRSTPWDPLVHTIELDCVLYSSKDFSEYVGLKMLEMRIVSDVTYRPPMNITRLVMKGGIVPNLTGLVHLKRLELENVDMSSIDALAEGLATFGGVPTTVTYLTLSSVTFSPNLTLLDFTRLNELATLYIIIDERHLENFPDEGDRNDEGIACIIANNHKLEIISLSRIKIIGKLPRSLMDIAMRGCKLVDSLEDLDRLKCLHVYRTQLADTIFPANLETITHLEGNWYRDLGADNGVRLSHLHALNSLYISGINIDGSLPTNITDLSINGREYDFDLSHLTRLSSLIIDSGRDHQRVRTPDFIDSINTRIVGPLSPSLRYLNLVASIHCFDLTNLHQLETLNIVGWSYCIDRFGTFPRSIENLTTDEDFDLKEIELPMLKTHKRVPTPRAVSREDDRG